MTAAYPLALSGPPRPADSFTRADNKRKTLYNPRGLHMGWDQRCPVGTVIKAPLALTITRVQTGTQYGDAGYVVAGVDRYGREWWFLHLRRYGHRCKVGQKVARGAPIAYSGESGNTTGPHLHVTRYARRLTGAWGSQPFENVYADILEAWEARAA
jgi:murein DD-endopeptidase MepM/ murein hydrolase activator NlpD